MVVTHNRVLTGDHALVAANVLCMSFLEEERIYTTSYVHPKDSSLGRECVNRSNTLSVTYIEKYLILFCKITPMILLNYYTTKSDFCGIGVSNVLPNHFVKLLYHKLFVLCRLSLKHFCKWVNYFFFFLCWKNYLHS